MVSVSREVMFNAFWLCLDLNESLLVYRKFSNKLPGDFFETSVIGNILQCKSNEI